MSVIRAFCFCFLLLVPAAQAADSVWVDKKPARWRLIAAEYDGKAYAALQIELKPGWHTYWRVPGASGIAPEFDFADSKAVKVGTPLFPAPYFFDDGVGGYFGYAVATGFVFPLEFKNEAASLNLSGLIGVCREVCVPFDIEAGLMLDRAKVKNSPHGAALAALIESQPAAASDKLGIGGISFDGVSLQIVVTGENLNAPQAMVVPGPHDVIGPQRIAARHPASYLLELPAWSKLDHPLIGRKLNLVIRDGNEAIEAHVRVRDHRLLPQGNAN